MPPDIQELYDEPRRPYYGAKTAETTKKSQKHHKTIHSPKSHLHGRNPLVVVPNLEGFEFSWRKLWAFTGPGFLMNAAFLDTGNIQNDLQAGALTRNKLLWVLLLAHILGLSLQRMAARLGVVTGKNLAEMSYIVYPKIPRLILWVMIELTIVGNVTDQVIGTATAFYLMSRERIPLYAGVLLSIIHTIVFLVIDVFGVRKLEAFFAFLFTTMAFAFGYQFFVVKPNMGPILHGIVVPTCIGCGTEELLTGISFVGVAIMPHNLYLYSELVKSRKINRNKEGSVREAVFYNSLESSLETLCSFIINLFVVAVFAHGLFMKTNVEVKEACDRQPTIDTDVFPNNTHVVEVNLYNAGVFLGCQYGLPAMYIYGIGIFASGQSATMTTTYSGESLMEGFLGIKLPRWQRMLISRMVPLGSALVLTVRASDLTALTDLSDFLDSLQMIQIPFALIPIITFTSSKKIMHNFSSSILFQTFALHSAILIIGINVYFIYDYILLSFGADWYVLVVLIVPTIAYFAFVAYLAIYCLIACQILPENLSLFGHSFDMPYEAEAPWLHEEQHSPQISPTILPSKSATV